MLTPHQQEKVTEAISLFSTNNIIIIDGSAGVGKTFAAAYLIENFLFGNVLCAAPTHNAVGVLKSKVLNAERLTFSTLQSALRMKRKIGKDGKKYFVPDFHPKYPPFKDVNYLVVDEASMIGEDALKYIEFYAKQQKCKVIFLGDNKQLPPVGEESSPVFRRNYPTVTLSEIVRQKGDHPIIHLSNDLTLIGKKEPWTNENGGFVYSNDTVKIKNSLAEVNGTDEMKYITMSNDEVDAVNQVVRDTLYGKPKRFEVGEYLIFKEPYGEKYYTNYKIKVEKIAIRSQPFNIIISVDPFTKKQVVETVDLKFYSINPLSVQVPLFESATSWNPIGSNTEEIDEIKALHEDSEKDFYKVADALKRNAIKGLVPWVEYYNFLEKFASLTYSHAMTIHKSQGCTFERVVFNVEDSDQAFFSAEYKQRLFYTAVTRASNLLILHQA